MKYHMPLKTAVIDAPSNLGLRPPQAGVVPGCYKMPWALRNAGLVEALRAVDLGCVIPPRYDPSWEPGETTRNCQEIAEYSGRLAERIDEALVRGLFPVVVGGDCSVLLGVGLALKNRGPHGLLFLDGHTDFRHLGNSGKVDAAAGEDLAISIGLGDSRLTNLSGMGPNFETQHVAALGGRPYDEHLEELKRRSIYFATSKTLLESRKDALDHAMRVVTDSTQGFWVHVDFDVVDSAEMFAADCPEPEGISFADLAKIISVAVSKKGCLGMDITIYDPDLDPSGLCATRIVSCLKIALSS